MLSNIQLSQMAQNNNIQLDDVIYKSDITNIKKKKNMNLILNLDNGNGGTHWTCYIKRGDNHIYFDSFGAIYPDIVKQYCNNSTKLCHNAYICQDLKTETCGYYCFGLIHYIENNKGNVYDLANAYINLFESNTKKNNKILQDYFNNNVNV